MASRMTCALAFGATMALAGVSIGCQRGNASTPLRSPASHENSPPAEQTHHGPEHANEPGVEAEQNGSEAKDRRANPRTGDPARRGFDATGVDGTPEKYLPAGRPAGAGPVGGGGGGFSGGGGGGGGGGGP